MIFYADVFRALNTNDVRYMIVGGVAVSLYGIPRMTQDLDIIIALDGKNVHAAVTAMTSIGYIPRTPAAPEQLANAETRKQWKEQKNMLVFSFFRGQKEYRVVDILFDHDLDFDTCYERRTTVNFESIALPLLHVDDLIALKRVANREQDVSDIKFLEQYVKNNEQ